MAKERVARHQLLNRVHFLRLVFRRAFVGCPELSGRQCARVSGPAINNSKIENHAKHSACTPVGSSDMANKLLRSLKQPATNTCALRERAIAEYHELLAADETLTSATFEKLRSAMRKNRLLYGERPIGIALRPHLLDQKQFRALTLSAERVTSALERVAAAVVQNP